MNAVIPHQYPGDYARYLAAKYGCGNEFSPQPAWVVVNDKPVACEIVEVYSAEAYYRTADYVRMADGNRSTSTYVFARHWEHRKPALTTLTDDFGDYRQWVAMARGT